jgi:hypothetical protein
MKFAARSTLLGVALLAAAPLHAEGWTQELAPYLWGSGMDGRVGVGPLDADVNMSFGDIVSNLDMGFMGLYRATNDRLSITADAIYMSLGATEKGPHSVVKADVGMDQVALEVDVGYEVIERLTLYGGLRYNDLESTLKLTDPLAVRRASLSENWIDPVVGAYYRIPLDDQWSVALRGDVGGFGVGSEFAWQGLATLRWQATPTFGVIAAYRYIAMDYENGKGADYFKYDMAIAGPALGMVFTF